jgi:hypothetical protein
MVVWLELGWWQRTGAMYPNQKSGKIGWLGSEGRFRQVKQAETSRVVDLWGQWIYNYYQISRRAREGRRGRKEPRRRDESKR